MNVPVDQILCSSETLAPRLGGLSERALESGEWLVLNKNWDGKIQVPVSCIKTDKNFKFPSIIPENAQKIMDEGIPPIRSAAHYISGQYEARTVHQPLKMRLFRAWNILLEKQK